MNAIQLLDSRSFRNKLDAFVAIASKKRAKDEDLAEYFQPIVDAILTSGSVVPRATLSPVAVAANSQPLDDGPLPVPQVERSIVERMADIVKDATERVKNTPSGPNGVRYVLFPMDTPCSELTGWTNDEIGLPFFIDPSEMTMMDTGGNGWLLPCRLR